MPVLAGALVDTVLQRSYDAGAVATTRAQVRDLLSRAQQLLQGSLNSVLVTKSLSAGPRQQVFAIAEFATDLLRVKAVRHGKRDLSQVPFDRLKHISAQWFGQSGPRWESFATLGRTILVVHPMMQQASTLTVIYTQILPVFNNDNDPVLLPDDHLPLLTRLTELLMLMRMRNFTAMKVLVAGLKQGVQSEVETEPDGRPSAAN